MTSLETAAGEQMEGQAPLGERVARWSIVAIAFVAPLVMSRLIGVPPLTHDTYELPKAVVVRFLAMLALAAWAGALAAHGGRLRLSPWLGPLGLYVGWTALATALSPAPLVSLLGAHGRLDGLVTALSYAAVAFVALQVLRSSDNVLSVLRATALAGLIVGAYGVAQVMHIDPFYYLPQGPLAPRAFSTFGNADFLGQYLVLAGPLAAAAALTDQNRTWRAVEWAGAIAVLGGLVATQGRTAWLVVAGELVLLTVILARKSVISRRVAVRVAAASAMALAAAAVGVALSPGAAQRWGAAVFSRDLADRVAIWMSALRGVAVRPLFGFGPDRFAQLTDRFPPAGGRVLASVTVDTAHNVPLQIAATAGVVAAVSWLIAVCWPLFASAHDVFSTRNDRGRLLLAGCWVGLLGLTLSLQTGISVIGATAIMWIVAAALMSPSASSHRVAPIRLGRVVAALLLTAVLAAGIWGSTLILADHAYLVGRMRLRGLTPGSPAEAYGRAIDLAPLDEYYRRALGVELAYTTPTPLRAREVVEDGLRLEPEDVELLIARARLEALGGDATAMQRDLDRARTLAPESELVRGFRPPVPTSGTQ
jgi:O-antigen ligase